MRPPARTLACLLALLAVAGWLRAIEKASAEMERERSTSAIEAVSLKPLILFSMRGRGDPFMAYSVLTNLPPSKSFDIGDLVFTGIVDVDGKVAALFKGSGSKTYFLRGNTLYDPQDKAVQGIRGSVVVTDAADDVVLVQGERKLAYTSGRPSKRLEENSPR